MTWFRKLWARWFCPYKGKDEFGDCWYHYAIDDGQDVCDCVGIKCKGCPLKENK